MIFQPTLNLSSPTTEVTRQIRGWTGYFVLQGEFDSGTVTLEFSLDDGTTWIPYSTTNAPDGTQLSWSGNGMGKVDLPYCLVRFQITGTAESNHDVDIYIW